MLSPVILFGVTAGVIHCSVNSQQSLLWLEPTVSAPSTSNRVYFSSRQKACSALVAEDEENTPLDIKALREHRPGPTHNRSNGDRLTSDTEPLLLCPGSHA